MCIDWGGGCVGKSLCKHEGLSLDSTIKAQHCVQRQVVSHCSQNIFLVVQRVIQSQGHRMVVRVGAGEVE